MSTGCPNVIVLTRFASGVLDEHIAQEVSHHLDQCGKCQTRTDDLARETDSLVLAIRASEVEQRLIGDDAPADAGSPSALDTSPATQSRKSDSTIPSVSDTDLDDAGHETSLLNRLIADAQQLAPESSTPSEPTRRSPRKADLDSFVTALRRSTLLDDSKIEDFVESTQADSTETFARELVDQGELTPYQAWALSRGRWKGLVLGNYEILEKLGQGGMGQVYRATHRRMGRIVCLKVLRSSGRRSPETVERFRREIKAISALDHPHFVIAHDADEADGIQFLVMEFVEGRDLARLVAEDGPLRWKDALRVVLQVAGALDYAHNEGVIHRDIKPHNLILTPDDDGGVGHAKVLDLGIARFDSVLGSADGMTRATMTTTGTIVGTVDYMSPEQALNSRHADARSDIYSLGCTLYFLMTGRTLHPGETIMERLVAHREHLPPRLRDNVPDADKGLEAVFQKMVAREPEDRYQNMAGVVEDLNAVLRGRRPKAQSLSIPFWLRDLLRHHRHPAVAISAVVCLVTMITAFAWLPDNTSGENPDPPDAAFASAGDADDKERPGEESRDPETPFTENSNRPLMVVVPSEGFSDEDCLATQSWLERKQIPYVLASSRTGSLKSSSHRNKVDVKKKIFEYSALDYSGLIFVGGSVGEFKDKGRFTEQVHTMIESTLQARGTVIGISTGKHVLECQGFFADLKTQEVNGLIVGSPKKFPGSKLIQVMDQGRIPEMAHWLHEGRRNAGR